MGNKAKINMSFGETANHDYLYDRIAKFIENGLLKQSLDSVKFGWLRCGGNVMFIDHEQNDVHWTEKSLHEFYNDSCECFDPGFGTQTIEGEFAFYDGDRNQIMDYDGNEYWHYTPAFDAEAFEDFKLRATKHKESEDVYGLPWYEINARASYQWFRMLGFDKERAVRAADDPNGSYDIDPKIAQEAYEDGYVHREDPNIEGPRVWVTRDYMTLFVKGFDKS